MFFPGSFIKNEVYDPFLTNIQRNLRQKNIKVNVTVEKYLPLKDANEISEDTILIGHSFGSYFALLNCIHNRRYNDNDNIKGCILINGHYNQRHKMLYSNVNMEDITQPVLMILNKDDEKLPLHKAIDDIFIKYEENLDNKYFIINNGTHLSSFMNDTIIEEQITMFIETIHHQNFTLFEEKTNHLYKNMNWNFNNTVYYHPNELTTFLKSRPKYNMNYLYATTGYVLLKTDNVNINEWIYNEYDNLKLPNRQLELKKIYLPFGENLNESIEVRSFFFLYTLSKWFTYNPKIIFENNIIKMEVIVIPIKENIVYYKFPNKYKLFL
jgi:hypothetical protein